MRFCGPRYAPSGEKSVLGHQMAYRERTRGMRRPAARYEEHAAQADEYAGLIVQHVLEARRQGRVRRVPERLDGVVFSEIGRPFRPSRRGRPKRPSYECAK